MLTKISARSVTSLTALFALAGALLACGSKPAESPSDASAPAPVEATPSESEAPSEASPSATSPAEASEPSALKRPSTPFKDMSPGEKSAYMKSVITPEMSRIFREHDAEKFPRLTCGTCHGAGAKNGTFAMPNPDLDRLDPTDGFAKHLNQPSESAITHFMMERVAPDMATLLGTEPYNPETGTGFGCFNCHTKK